LLNCFSEFSPISSSQFARFSVPILIDYLERSHAYYINKRLPEIGQTIDAFLKKHQESHPFLIILSNFYRFYKDDLEEHFEYEEKHLFPYGKWLSNSFQNRRAFNQSHHVPIHVTKYSIEEFIKYHDDSSEIELKEVRKALLKYQPKSENQLPNHILFEQLKNLEEDLHLHAVIEDDVLIPKLSYMEKETNNFRT